MKFMWRKSKVLLTNVVNHRRGSSPTILANLSGRRGGEPIEWIPEKPSLVCRWGS
jgi:hypothetical protein